MEGAGVSIKQASNQNKKSADEDIASSYFQVGHIFVSILGTEILSKTVFQYFGNP